jgi:hypothetical protein
MVRIRKELSVKNILSILLSAAIVLTPTAQAAAVRNTPTGIVTFSQTTTPSTPTSGKNKVYTKSDNKLYTLDSTGTEKAVGTGAGAGGVNFIGQDTSWNPNNTDDRDLEGSVGNWLAFANTVAGSLPDNGMTGGTPSVTCTRSTSSPLDKTASLLITKGATNRQGDGCSVVYNVQPAYQGSTATITFPLNIVSGSLAQGDVKVFVYNVTKSTLITPFNNDVLANGTLTATFPLTAMDASPVNHQYRLGIYFASTAATAVTLKADNFSVSPGQAAYGLAGSNSGIDTRLTFSAGFGTATSSISTRRTGDRYIGDGYLTAGTTAATAAYITLPSGYSVDTAKTGSAANLNIVGSWTEVPGSVGPYNLYTGGISGRLYIDPSNPTRIFFASSAGSGALTNLNSNAVAATGERVNVNFDVPIAGFDANVTLGASSTFKISSYLANGTRVTGSAPTQLGQYRSYLRNASANTYTETSGTPSAAPSGADGIKIWNAAWASGDTSAQPSKYEIFVGKNKNVSFQFYGSAARTGVYDPAPNYSSTFYVGTVKNYDPTTGIVTITGINGSGSTAGAAVGWDGSNGTVNPGFFDIVVSENALAVGIQAPRSEVQAKGSPAAGFGSTNTRIRRFNSAQVNTGTAITYADSATLGGSFTINEDGVYAISYYDYTPAGTAQMGISKNTTGPTTAVFSLTDTEIVCAVTVTSAFRGYCGNTLNLKQGDVIRAHTDGTQGNSQDGTQTRFTITKVSN